MIRKQDSIPNFVKQFKADFFSYTLNLNKANALKLTQSEVELSKAQDQTLNEIIKVCRSIRLDGIDQNDPNCLLYFTLREAVDNGTHLFNKWRKQCGGSFPSIENKDKLISTLQTLGIETYPAFLMKKPRMDHFPKSISVSHRHKLGKPLINLITSDDQLKLLFNITGDSEMNTYCSFVASTGRGGSIQLATFADRFLMNSYYLMLLNGQNDIQSYLKSIEENITLLREIAINKEAQTYVFMGYSNVALPKDTLINIPHGQLITFDENFLEILPEKAIHLISDGIRPGFMYKGKLTYSFKHKSLDKDVTWPKEMKQNREKLEQIDEDISIATSLSCERNPAVSLSCQWTAIFDPLNYGVSLSWNNKKTPTPSYKCTDDDITSIKDWCNTIHETEDSKIRLAKRKTISAISHRQNPIDGFIDAIIAWENLFGANAELSFRISSAISCLLEGNKTKRKTLYKKIKKAYDRRSSIVHGVKEISYEKAKELRDSSIEICLACITNLYKKHPELITKDDRSLTILLEHE